MNNKQPEAVVFDLGKVLVDFDYGIAVNEMIRHCSCSKQELLKLINQSPLLYEYEEGLISTAQFFEKVRAATGFQSGLEVFSECFADIFTEIPPMVDLLRQLKARQCPVYVFSNTNELAVRHIRNHFPFFALFDGFILSYEQRCLKPQPGLYEVVEKISQKSGSAIFYIDDREENTDAGARRGWQTILHCNPEETRARVGELGLLK